MLQGNFILTFLRWSKNVTTYCWNDAAETAAHLAILKADGKFSWVLFIDSESERNVVFLICFIIFCGKLFGPVLLLVFKSWILLVTFSGEFGYVNKVFGLGLLRSYE